VEVGRDRLAENGEQEGHSDEEPVSHLSEVRRLGVEVQLDVEFRGSGKRMHDDGGCLGPREDGVVDDEHRFHRIVLRLRVESLLLDPSDVEDILEREEARESDQLPYGVKHRRRGGEKRTNSASDDLVEVVSLLDGNAGSSGGRDDVLRHGERRGRDKVD
jgi:hypothetical protein